MRYFVPGSRGIYVSVDEKFFYQDGSVCELPVHDNLVEIEQWGATRRVDRTWLKHVAVFGIDDPKLLDHVKFLNIKGKKRGYQSQVIFTKPQWHNKTHRIVPGFTTIAIDRRGNCIEIKTGESPALAKGNGYIHAYVYDPRYQKMRSVGVHRLVALAWVRNPIPQLNYVVNHKDGNKINNSCTNLEWTTHLGNNLHAIQSGLRPVAVKCRARDIYTNEVTTFPSMAALTEFLGLRDKSKDQVLFRTVRANKLINDRYEVRIGDDDIRPWEYDDTTMNVESSRYIIRVTDGEQTLKFNGVRSLIRHYKLWNLGTMSAARATKVLKERHPQLEIHVLDQYETRPIEVFHTDTQTVTTYRTMRDVVHTIGVCKTVVMDAVRKDGRKIVHGYRMRYKSTAPWPDDDLSSKFTSRRIEVVNRQTQEMQIFDSLRAAASALDMDRNAIKRHIRKPLNRDLYAMKVVHRSADQVEILD